jgi:hypothetical protein
MKTLLVALAPALAVRAVQSPTPLSLRLLLMLMAMVMVVVVDSPRLYS